MGTRKGQRQSESIVNSTFTSISALTLLFVSFYFGSRHYFLAGILSVAVGDGLGEFIGKPYGKHKYKILSAGLSARSFIWFVKRFCLWKSSTICKLIFKPLMRGVADPSIGMFYFK